MGRNIIKGQKIVPEKLARAKELRKWMTPGEKALWEKIRASQCQGYHFRRQQVIAGYIADFYSDEAGLVIEVDGSIHDLQKEYDNDRDQVFTALGLTVLRVHEEEVINHIHSVILTIKAALSEKKLRN